MGKRIEVFIGEDIICFLLCRFLLYETIDSFSYFDLLLLLNKNVDENTNVLSDFKDVEYVSASGFKALMSI